MADFTFYNPTKILFGKGKILDLGSEIKGFGNKKVLLVAGKSSIKNNGVYEQVTSTLSKNNIEIVELWGVQANPTLTKVNEGLQLAKENEVDAILAVGGGSVIDTCKSIAGGYYLNNVWDLFEGKSNVEKALPLFVVLTLSATGSEMNCGAVLTNEEEHKKWNFKSSKVYPLVSVIDPAVQTSLPWDQTANGAIDALAHIMEFYFMGTEEETNLSLNESLMNSIIKVTDQLKEDPNNYELRSNLAWAATLALNGISGAMLNGGDWASHRIEHGLSAFDDKIAHGTGLAIIFPSWIIQVAESNPQTFKRWAKSVWNSDSVEGAIEKMQNKFKQWEIPTTLTELGIKEENFDNICDLVMQKDTGIIKELNREDILMILKRAL
jgi:alcohol dehydrogenase